MSKKIKLPQNHIKVLVEFYDKEQENKLLAYPTNKQIKEIVHNGIEVPTEEFLTYYLFYRKRPGKPGYRDYDEIGEKIGKSLSDLEDFINFNGNSISTPEDVGEQDIHITERVGESVGLSVINRIHGISAADWERIKKGDGIKIFDYGIASDGKSIIQVETKGSSIDNNDSHPSTVSNHKSSIISKKAKIAELESERAYPYPANLRYGTITVLDNRLNSTVKCLLVDPPPVLDKTPPAKLRLINRMQFLQDWISFISPRSQLATALSTRIADIEALSNPFELDNVPLMKGTGEPFEPILSPSGTGYTLNFLSGKSHVMDETSSGIVIQMSKDTLFFLGIMDEISILAAKQDFESIISYKALTGIIPKAVQCVFHKKRFERLNLPNWVKKEAKKSGDYSSFNLKGELMYNQDGLVFGILPMEA